MGQIHLSGNPAIAVTLRRSARARQLSLRLSRLDGRVTLTLPQGVTEAQATAFLRDKESWLRKHLAAQEEPVIVAPGVEVTVEGQPMQIVAAGGRGVRRVGRVLEVGGTAEQCGPRLRGWLREHARARLTAASDHYAARLGRPYSRITLRDTRSRWGSCTSDGGLMYSWRLILAPPEVLDYVAAHEVAHLAQMNHSPAFWAEVERLYGDWRGARGWLRDHGGGLHRFRFEGWNPDA